MLVSFLMPSRRENELKRCLEIVNKVEVDKEILVVAKYPMNVRVNRIYLDDEYGGFCDALNAAVDEAHGDVIFRIEDDDEFKLTDIYDMVECYNYLKTKYENVGMVGCCVVSPRHIYLEKTKPPLISAKILYKDESGLIHVTKPDKNAVVNVLDFSIKSIDQEHLHYYIIEGAEKNEVWEAHHFAGDFWVGTSDAIKKVKYDSFFFNPYMCDDIDLCLGVRKLGYKNFLYPHVVIYAKHLPDRERFFDEANVMRVFNRLREKYGNANP